MEGTNKVFKGMSEEKKFQIIFENANTAKDVFCPVRDVISRVNDKWTMLTIYALGGFGVLRFNELKSKIGDVSQRMLTVTLRNLEADGLVSRKIYAEVPPRVEYRLTELGDSLMHQMEGLTNWANTNGEEILKSRNKYNKK